MYFNEPIAAIDIGTNSIHMVVAKVENNHHLNILDSEKVTIRLGQEIDQNQMLKPSGINAVVQTIRDLKEICSSYTKVIRVVATYAMRVAKNHQDLIDEVYNKTGLQIEVIDGIEEARLSFLGVRQGLQIDEQSCLCIDVGGGSTEIIVGNGNKINLVRSISLGAVLLNKEIFTSEKIKKKEIEILNDTVSQSLAPLIRVASQQSFMKAIATSGTAKALAAGHAHLYSDHELEYVNGYEIPCEDLFEMYRVLEDLRTPSKIKKHFNLDDKRSEIILAGAAIFIGLTKLFGVKSWTISAYGLREGIVVDMIDRDMKSGKTFLSDLRWNNVVNFGDRLNIEVDFGLKVSELALQIYEGIEPLFFPGVDPDMLMRNRELLKVAAYLHEVGKFVNFSRYHRHGNYLLAQSTIMGFTQTEKRLIGYIIRYHRKDFASRKIDCEPLLAGNINRINKLASCLRLATALNRTRRGKIEAVSVKLGQNRCRLIVSCHDGDVPEAELLRTEKQLKKINSFLGTNISIEVKALNAK